MKNIKEERSRERKKLEEKERSLGEIGPHEKSQSIKDNNKYNKRTQWNWSYSNKVGVT